MIVESAQMLSTAHRMLDGEVVMRPSKSGKRMLKYYLLNDSRENVMYKAVHHNHPCTVWTRESVANYMWHFEHFRALLAEYTYRYCKTHKTESLLDALSMPPVNLRGDELTPFVLAMGDQPHLMKHSDPVGSYRAFYKTKRQRFDMSWRGRAIPHWFNS